MLRSELSSLLLLAIMLTNLQAQQGGVTLPNKQGQIWQQYDVSRYTSAVAGVERPEQAIIDWILRETGTEVWHREPFGILNGNRNKVTVYHQREMHKLVGKIVDRFVQGHLGKYVLNLRLVTVGSPNWRSKAYPLLKPVNVRSPGVEAWLMPKENAVLLLADLKKRMDFREHNPPQIVTFNGQPATIARTQPRTFTKRFNNRGAQVPIYEAEMGKIDEGYSIQVSPLWTPDERTIDAVIKCDVDLIEKFVDVPLDVPTAAGKQRVQLQVPQLVSWRLHERFRWPADHVLVLSCGVVATPGSKPNTFASLNPFASKGRADALLFVESKGRAEQVLIQPNKDLTRVQPLNTRR